MPTGYTAVIKDGIRFEQFAMNCARAFGAMISMRDLPSNAPVPEKFEPSPYHSEQLALAQTRLKELEEMPQDAIADLIRAEYRAKVSERAKRLAENTAQISAYRDMLVQVQAWKSPSVDHDKMKNFMVEQLESSIEFDDMGDYYSQPVPDMQTADEWLAAQKLKALDDIRRHANKAAEELKRTEERNTWLRLLRESLK